jgi:hypothetical protein
MGSCTLMEVYPTDSAPSCPAAVPVAGAGDDLEVAGAAPLAGDRQAGAACLVSPHRLGGGEFLALHTGASHDMARARGRRRVQGGSAIKLTNPRQVATGWPATPGGLVGAVAGVTHTDEGPMRKPPYQLCQPPPGEVCWRPLPGAVHALPLRGAGPRPPKTGSAQGRVAHGNVRSSARTPH